MEFGLTNDSEMTYFVSSAWNRRKIQLSTRSRTFKFYCVAVFGCRADVTSPVQQQYQSSSDEMANNIDDRHHNHESGGQVGVRHCNIQFLPRDAAMLARSWES